MKVIVKEPGRLPQIIDLDVGRLTSCDVLDAVRLAVGGRSPANIEAALSVGTSSKTVIAWCDEDGKRKAWPKLNFVRPDGQEIVGNIVVTGMIETLDGMDIGPLGDTDAALGMWILSHLFFRTCETVGGLELAMQEYGPFQSLPDEPTTMHEMHARLMTDNDRSLVATILALHGRPSYEVAVHPVPKLFFFDLGIPSLASTYSSRPNVLGVSEADTSVDGAPVTGEE